MLRSKVAKFPGKTVLTVLKGITNHSAVKWELEYFPKNKDTANKLLSFQLHKHQKYRSITSTSLVHNRQIKYHIIKISLKRTTSFTSATTAA